MPLSSKFEGFRQIWQFDNRWHLLFLRTLFKGEHLNVYKYKGLEFLSDHLNGDANGARELLTSQMYRQLIPKMNLAHKPLNVLDLGANNGGFPLLLKSENLKIQKLACIELNPRTFVRMRFNVESNINCEFFPLNVAVCGEPRDFILNFESGDTSNNIYQEASKSENSFKIEGFTVDEIYQRTFGDDLVDLCKIDIEGAEFEVFETDNHHSIKNCHYVLMEIHHEKTRRREVLQKKLNDLGFMEIGSENKIGENAHYVHFFVNQESI